MHSGTDSPDETTLDPCLDDPFPDTEPVVAFSATSNVRQRPNAPLALLVQRPPAAGRSCLTSGHTFVTLARIETHAFGFRLRANAPEGQKQFPIRPRRAKSDFLSVMKMIHNPASVR